MVTDRTEVALQILKAVQHPKKPADVDALLLYLLCPGHDHMELEELARLVAGETTDVRAARYASAYFGD